MFSRFAVPTSFSRASKLSLSSVHVCQHSNVARQTFRPCAQRQLHHSGLDVFETCAPHKLLQPEAYPAVLFGLDALQVQLRPVDCQSLFQAGAYVNIPAPKAMT